MEPLFFVNAIAEETTSSHKVARAQEADTSNFHHFRIMKLIATLLSFLWVGNASLAVSFTTVITMAMEGICGCDRGTIPSVTGA